MQLAAGIRCACLFWDCGTVVNLDNFYCATEKTINTKKCFWNVNCVGREDVQMQYESAK